MNTEAAYRLPFRPLHDQARIPKPPALGDAGIDLPWQPFLDSDDAYDERVAAAVSYGFVTALGTGFAVEIPAGHVGMVVPRSGLAKTEGITVVNAPGIIDSSYRGEIIVLLSRLIPGHTLIRPRDRIAQLLIAPCEWMLPILATDLSPSERGDKGFGSTGR